MNLVYIISIALFLITLGINGDPATNYMSPLRKMRQKEILSRAGQNDHDIESLLNIIEIYKKRLESVVEPSEETVFTPENNEELRLLSMKIPSRQKDMSASSVFAQPTNTAQFARSTRPLQEFQQQQPDELFNRFVHSSRLNEPATALSLDHIESYESHNNEPMEFLKDIFSNQNFHETSHIALPANSQPIQFSQSIEPNKKFSQTVQSKPVVFKPQPSESFSSNQGFVQSFQAVQPTQSFSAAAVAPSSTLPQPAQQMPTNQPAQQFNAQSFQAVQPTQSFSTVDQSSSSLPQPLQQTPTAASTTQSVQSFNPAQSTQTAAAAAVSLPQQASMMMSQPQSVQSSRSQAAIQFNQPMQFAHSNQQIRPVQPNESFKFNQQAHVTQTVQPTLQSMQPMRTVESTHNIQPAHFMSPIQPTLQPMQPIQPIEPTHNIQSPHFMPNQLAQPIQPVQQIQPTIQMTMEAKNTTSPQIPSTSTLLRPMQPRTSMGISESQPATMVANEMPKTLSLNGFMGPQMHQFYDPSVSLSMTSLNPPMLPTTMPNGMGFDQTAFLMNQFMMPSQAPSLGMVPQGGYQSGSGPNYFQSNSFSNNPKRKNNDLNKARKELLSDPQFLKDNAKLSHFLFTKYLKEASDPENEEQIETAPAKTPIKFRRVDKKKMRDDRKNRKQTNEEKMLVDEEMNEFEEIKDEKIRPKETVKEEKTESMKTSDEEKPAKEVVKKEPKAPSKASVKTLASKFAAKENESKNVALVDLDDLENYLNSIKDEMDHNQQQQIEN